MQAQDLGLIREIPSAPAHRQLFPAQMGFREGAYRRRGVPDRSSLRYCVRRPQVDAQRTRSGPPFGRAAGALIYADRRVRVDGPWINGAQAQSREGIRKALILQVFPSHPAELQTGQDSS
jgi:hypothetical protein